MSMSTYIEGVRDFKVAFDKMWAAAKACEAARVPFPEEIREYFSLEKDSDLSVKEYHESDKLVFDLSDKPGVESYEGGYEVDLRKLPKDVTKIRFRNSW